MTSGRHHRERCRQADPKKGRGGGGACPSPLSPGSRAKGHRGRLVTAYELPGHRNVRRKPARQGVFSPVRGGHNLDYPMKHSIHPAAAVMALAVVCWVPGDTQAQSAGATVSVASAPLAESVECPIRGGSAVLQRMVLPGRARTDHPSPSVAPPRVPTRSTRPWFGPSQHPRYFIMLSATVYDRRRTLLRWQVGGDYPRSYAAWSNIDFNHFSGVGVFDQSGKHFALFMGISNQDTARMAARMAAFGRIYQPPIPPPLLEDVPCFVVVEGDPADAGALLPVMALHEYYRSERSRLVTAFAERERQRVAREAAEKALAALPVRRTLRHYSIPPKENPIPRLQGGKR